MLLPKKDSLGNVSAGDKSFRLNLFYTEKELFMTRNFAVFSMLGLLLSTGCRESQVTEPANPQTTSAVYVCNAGASTLSVIDLETRTVTNDVAPVGTWPNQLVYNDKRVYCVNSGSNNITVFNTTSGKNESPIELGNGLNPMNMVLFNDNWMYVTCLLTNQVLQIDRASGNVVKTIRCDLGTTGIASANGKVYASNTNADFSSTPVSYGPGTVTVIDGVSGDSIKSIIVATNPQAVGRSADGRIHVLCTGNYVDSWGKVLVIDPQTDLVTDTIDIGGSPGGLDVTSEADIGYLSYWGLGLLSYDTGDFHIIHGFADFLLGKGGSGLVSDAEGNVFVSIWEENQVIQLNSAGEVIGSWAVNLDPQALALRAD